jgi:hypothetical protein
MKKILLFIVIVLAMVSCASWNQKSSEYYYFDDGETLILNNSKAIGYDENIRDFPVYGAFSKSIYLDDNSSATKTKTIEDFCNQENTIFRPLEWTKVENLKILNERKLAHSQLKLEVEAFTKKITDSKSVALIVFRGTDFEEDEDWASNFRWFNRYFSSKLDQYDEVRVLLPFIGV